MKYIYLFVILFILFNGQARASDAQSNAIENSWRAFSCSFYASLQNNTAEQERLFELGYKEGIKGLKQLEDGILSNQDVMLSVSEVMNILEGPNNEFILGRIYQRAISYSKEKFYINKRNLQSDPRLLGLRAESYYESMFCATLGTDE